MRACLFIAAAVSISYAADLPRRAWLGAAFQSGEGGTVAIASVLPGGPAEAAGLRAGDVVVTLDGKKLDVPADAVTLVRSKPPGSVVAVHVRRGAEDVKAELKVTALPLESAPDIEVVYDAVNVRGALRRIIVTRPKNAAKAPAVLLVGGVGCYPADNPLMPPAYTEILHRLTRAGFVTMRVEKSGMGDSGGAPCQAVDFETELDGYRAGLRGLSRLAYVDAANVFIFGHSMGGVAGPVLAKEFPLRGLMVMATVGDSWFEYELSNVRRQRTVRGDAEREIDRAVAHRRDCVYNLLILRADRAQGCDDVQYPASLAYMQQVAAVPLGETWEASAAPVLVMRGNSDYVSGEPDHRYLAARLNRKSPGRATLMLIPNLDHFFVRAATEQQSLEGKGNGMNFDWVPQMAEWMRNHMTLA